MTAREPWFDSLRSLTEMDVIDWGERVHEVADALPVLLDIAEAARDLQPDSPWPTVILGGCLGLVLGLGLACIEIGVMLS